MHISNIYRRKYRTKVQVNRDVSHAHAYLGSAHAARGGTPWQKKPVALAGTRRDGARARRRCARGRAAAARPTTRDATVDKIIARPVEVPDITRMHRYISVLTRPSMLDHRVQRADRIVVCFSLPRRAGLPRATRPRQNTAKVVSGVWTERGPGSRITIMRTLPRVLCTGFGRGFPCCTAKQRSPRDSGCHESP